MSKDFLEEHFVKGMTVIERYKNEVKNNKM